MKEEKRKNWFRRHWILTSLGAIFLLLVIRGMFGVEDSDTSSIQAPESQETSENSFANVQTGEKTKEKDTPINNKEDVWSKTSGYTLSECYEVCEGIYDIAMQVSICQGNCATYGKPSDSMDKYVNIIKEIKR